MRWDRYSRTCCLFRAHFLSITLCSFIMVSFLLALFQLFLFLGVLCSCEIPLVSSGHSALEVLLVSYVVRDLDKFSNLMIRSEAGPVQDQQPILGNNYLYLAIFQSIHKLTYFSSNSVTKPPSTLGSYGCNKNFENFCKLLRPRISQPKSGIFTTW